MDDQKEFSLSPIEKTMFLPLWGRVKETQKPNGIIKDFKSVEIAQKLNLDFSTFEQEQNPVSQLAWVARAYNVDAELHEILKENADTTVINIGCGMDTSYFRLSKPEVKWFDIDLPAVIQTKRKIISEEKNYKLIPGSVLGKDVFRNIPDSGRIVIIAVGLLYYFTEDEVKTILSNIAEHFHDVTLVAEYCSPRGVEIGNKRVLQNVKGTKMIWGVKKKSQLKALNPNISTLTTYPIFKKVRKQITKDHRKYCLLSDILKIMSFAVIRIHRN